MEDEYLDTYMEDLISGGPVDEAPEGWDSCGDMDDDDGDPGDMDGDAASALASCGWGTDEDYGDGYGDDGYSY